MPAFPIPEGIVKKIGKDCYQQRVGTDLEILHTGYHSYACRNRQVVQHCIHILLPGFITAKLLVDPGKFNLWLDSTGGRFDLC